MAAAVGCRFANVPGTILGRIWAFELTKHARNARRYRLMKFKQ
jgi:hypothetical protein